MKSPCVCAKLIRSDGYIHEGKNPQWQVLVLFGPCGVKLCFYEGTPKSITCSDIIDDSKLKIHTI